MKQRTCEASGCESPLLAKGLCNAHYKRFRKYGDLDLPYRPSLEERIWRHVEKTENCWLWRGGRTTAGYGTVNVKRQTRYVHRLVFEMHYGHLPSVIDHICHNRACVRPTHLRAVTKKQNSENRAGPGRPVTSSGIRGVTWFKRDQKWVAQAGAGGRTYYGGRYDSLMEAEAAAIELRNRLFTHNVLDRS